MSCKKEYRENRYLKRWVLAKKAVDYLGGKCKICGENHPAALSFHHRDPKQKEFDVSRKIQSTAKWEIIKTEVDKCDLLCENCHRKLHFDQDRYDDKYELICKKANGFKSKKEMTITKWSEDDVEKLIFLYNEGKSSREISLSLNRNDDVIRSKIKKLMTIGVLSIREKPPRSKRTKVTKELIDQVLKLSCEFISAFEISKTTGISLGRVHRILREKKNGE